LLEPLTGIELVTFRYGRSTNLDISAASIQRRRSVIPAQLFKSDSRALAPFASSNSSRAINSHGWNALVQRPFFVLCSFRRRTVSAVLPM
jgi:hypothetical protein